MTRWRLKALLVTAPAMAAALVIAGCGGGSGDAAGAGGGYASGPGARSATTVDGTTIDGHGSADVAGRSSVEIEMDDDYFSPSILTGTPGQQVAIELRNEGGVEHNFTLASQKVDTDVEPGKSATVMVTIPQSGVVTFTCEYHVAKGMAGALRAS